MIADSLSNGLRRFAAHHGHATIYNETMTQFWVLLVAHVMETRPQLRDIAEAGVQIPMLADKQLPFRHWSREAIFSPEARVSWREPDLAPLALRR